MIDSEGYRANVGIILCNQEGKLFWGRRVGQDAWQFPQGGIMPGESPEQAVFRELWEEVGLDPDHVEILGYTRGWLRYHLPKRYVRREQVPLCIGQKQIWFLLRLRTSVENMCFNRTSKPEFDHWRWIDYWAPVREVVAFKRQVYRAALRELAPLLFGDNVRQRPRHHYRRRARRVPQSRGE